MSSKNRNRDDNYEKPSKHKQWQEKSERPIAVRAMTADEIEEHRFNLIQSYQCDDGDITYDFQKIQDENDEDRDDCLWLKYKMKCIIAGKPTVKDIFSIKLPIPEELKRMAEQLRKEQAARARNQRKPMKAISDKQDIEEPIEAPEPVNEEPSEALARPKLRKPVRTVKK